MNIKEEQTKFLLNPQYNPQFKYKVLTFDPNNLFSRLKRIEYPDTPIGRLWKKKADEIVRKINLLEARETDEFTQKSIELYGAPDDHLLGEALKEVAFMPEDFPSAGKNFTAKEAKKIFEKAILDYFYLNPQLETEDDFKQLRVDPTVFAERTDKKSWLLISTDSLKRD